MLMKTDNTSKEVLHTQGEWKSALPFKFQFGNHLIETDQQVICRLMENDYDDKETAQANAELICKAVNERQKLIEALSKLVKWEHTVRNGNCNSWKTEMLQDIKDAKNLLPC